MPDSPRRKARRADFSPPRFAVSSNHLLVLALAAALAVLTFAVYWQVLGHDFIICYDDEPYVTQNPHVRAGLTRDSIAWAFTTYAAGNWHPLTWLSHMADVQIYGLKPWGHHLTNLIFHILNTLLLFFVLARMTGTVWKSGFVAALFAVHPLHVESVAWVAERKDVLSTFFWMLTMGAYVLYAERPGVLRYLPVFVFLALGLMAKPMLVTLPLALLLLDHWPLGRLRTQSNRTGLAPWKLVIEKLPLFALVLASSVITIIAQREVGAMVSLQRFSFGVRAANAVVAYVTYIWKTVWPSGLAFFYPHRNWPAWAVAGAAALMTAISVLALRARKNRPFLTVGWLWYVGTLVPVIGLVQVGEQAMADRYTYLPLLGLFIMAAWGAAELPVAKRDPRRLAAPALAAIVALSVACRFQVGLWRDCFTLFDHAMAVTSGNYLAHNNLGTALFKEGRLDEALGHYRAAIEIDPEYADAHTNVGIVLAKKRRLDEATAKFREAIRLDPNSASAHNNLGVMLDAQGRSDEAEAEFARALEIKPDFAEPYFNKGRILARRGRIGEAVSHFRKALALNPAYADARNGLGVILKAQGKPDEAAKEFEEALRADPMHADAHNNLGIYLAEHGRLDEAVAHFEAAVRADPNEPSYAGNLSRARDALQRRGPAR